MGIQERYWKAMVQAYFSCAYLELYYEQSVKRDRGLNVFLAIVSCGSIAGWAIWNQFAIIWAIAVAASQAINAIKHIIPYSKRIEDIFKYKWELCEISRELEYNWHAVANGQFTADEVNGLIDKAKLATNHAAQKYLDKDCLPRSQRYRRKADDITDDYFQNNF